MELGGGGHKCNRFQFPFLLLVLFYILAKLREPVPQVPPVPLALYNIHALPEILYAKNFRITYLSDPTTANFFFWSTANILSEVFIYIIIQSLGFVHHTKCLQIPHRPITMSVQPTITTSATFWRFLILTTIHSYISIFQSAPMIFDFLYLFSFYFDIFNRVCLNVFNFIL